MHCSMLCIEQYICTNDDNEKLRRISEQKIRILRMIHPVNWYILMDVSTEHAASAFRLYQSYHKHLRKSKHMLLYNSTENPNASNFLNCWILRMEAACSSEF
jgi:hypothetical protein